MFKNKLYCIKGCKSKLFYMILTDKCKSRGNMETIYSKQFIFPNHIILWRNIYSQKTVDLKIPKLCEFNYKLLHNILPCGKVLYKWKKVQNDKCDHCGLQESAEHMLFSCNRIRNIWKLVSDVLKVNIGWKQIICGYPNHRDNPKICAINYIITIIAYAIFKQNSISKFENTDYRKINMLSKVKCEIRWYTSLLGNVDRKVVNNITYQTFVNNF